MIRPESETRIVRSAEGPDKQQFYRIYPQFMMTDEAYVWLSCLQWGMVFQLLNFAFQQDGTLPDDNAKLAKIAQVTKADIEQLRQEWPKLEVVPDQPDRVTVPYFYRMFHEIKNNRDANIKNGKAGAAARWNKEPQVTLPDSPPIGSPSSLPIGDPNGKEKGKEYKLIEEESNQKEQEQGREQVQLSPPVPLGKDSSSDRLTDLPVPVPSTGSITITEYSLLSNQMLSEWGKLPIVSKRRQFQFPDELNAYMDMDPAALWKLRAAMVYLDENPESRDKVTLDYLVRDYGRILSEFAAKRLHAGSLPMSYEDTWYLFDWFGEFPNKRFTPDWNDPDWMISVNEWPSGDAAMAAGYQNEEEIKYRQIYNTKVRQGH